MQSIQSEVLYRSQIFWSLNSRTCSRSFQQLLDASMSDGKFQRMYLNHFSCHTFLNKNTTALFQAFQVIFLMSSRLGTDILVGPVAIGQEVRVLN